MEGIIQKILVFTKEYLFYLLLIIILVLHSTALIHIRNWEIRTSKEIQKIELNDSMFFRAIGSYKRLKNRKFDLDKKGINTQSLNDDLLRIKNYIFEKQKYRGAEKLIAITLKKIDDLVKQDAERKESERRETERRETERIAQEEQKVAQIIPETAPEPIEAPAESNQAEQPSPEPASSPTPAPASLHTPISQEEAISEIKRLVNVEREKAGLSPLQSNAQLDEAGALKVAHMVKYKYFAHCQPDTKTCDDDFAVEAGFGYAVCNLFYSSYPYPSPSLVVEVWMNSLGHRSFILEPSHKYIGIGYGYGFSALYLSD